MTTDRNADRIIGAWLDLMPDEAPDRAIEAILSDVETTRQARSSFARPDWRNPRMTRLLLVAAAAALGVALLGAALLVGGRPYDAPAPTTSPDPTLAPTAGATSPSPSVAAHPPLDRELRASWVADDPGSEQLGTGAGPVGLRIDSTGTLIETDNFGGAGNASSMAGQEAETFVVTLRAAIGDCREGDEGTYRWSLSSDRSQLTLSAIEEPCAARRIELERLWFRSLLSDTATGAGVIDTMDPPLFIALPDDNYSSRTLDDFAEVDSSSLGLMVFKNLQGFSEPCGPQTRYPYTPGADALVAYFRQNDAFKILKEEELEVDGHRAIHLVTQASANYAPCPGQELLMYTPKACDCHFVAGPGLVDDFYLVEVGEDTFMFELSPYNEATDRPIIDSIRIPMDLGAP
jgi:hypothetical protein